MTPSEFAYWQRAHKRVQGLQPDMAQALLRAFQNIRDQLTDAQLARLIASGNIEAVLREAVADVMLDRALLPVRQRLRLIAERGFQYSTVSLPGQGKVNGLLSVAFDTLSPDVVTALRALDTRVLATLKTDIRETVRAYVENGIRDGVNPRAIARDLKGVIGLGKNQLQEVENFRAALLGKDGRNPFTYTARDKRFDGTIRKGNLTQAQVDKMVDVYRKRRLAINTEANARTATLDAFKAGQRLSWSEAIDKGIVDGGLLKHQWIGVMDTRERPEHVAMEKETQPWDQPYSNGELVPGESTYNCRCLDFFFMESGAGATVGVGSRRMKSATDALVEAA